MRLILILAIVLIICLWLYLGHWVFNKKNTFIKSAWVVATILPFLTFYFLTNPNINYYKEQFTFFSGYEFPSNGILIDHSSTFPNTQGNYSVCGVFKAPASFIAKLNTAIPKIQNDLHKPKIFCNLRFKQKNTATNILDINEIERGISGTLAINTKFNIVHFQFFVN